MSAEHNYPDRLVAMADSLFEARWLGRAHLADLPDGQLEAVARQVAEHLAGAGFVVVPKVVLRDLVDVRDSNSNQRRAKQWVEFALEEES